MRNGLLLTAQAALGPSAACAGLSADLSITKTDGALTSTPGEQITYTITAFNAGPSSAPGSGFGDLFLAPLEDCSWSCVGQNGGSCSVANGTGANANQSVDLPVGGSIVVTATCTIDPGATLSFFNTATITEPAGFVDPVGVNNSSTDVNGLEPEADLVITKTDNSATFVPGGSTTYTIVASNAGPSDAPGATVSDTFPASLTCNWTCAGNNGGTCTAAGAGNINDVVNLPAGGSVTYTANCSIANGTPPPLENTATVTAPQGIPDPNPDNNSATDSNGLGAPGIPALEGFGLAALGVALAAIGARRLRRRR